VKYLRDIGFILAVSVAFAGLTAGVNQALSHRIALNQETRDTKYLLEVFDIPFDRGAGAAQLKSLETGRIASAEMDGRRVYRLYGESGTPEGYAFPIGGKGFWGNISGLLALDRELLSIRHIVFTSHNETPGLGGRIVEEAFRDQFRGLAIADVGDNDKFVRISSRNGATRNRVDAITGATMTSSLVEKFLNADLAWISARKERLGRLEWRFPRER
jgi:Na+-transporting NADH:ubiquinone oxidoreductase subunit C